eukprot:TRINITY_DN6185_c0_g3_i1.p1 TRINITY_DN6185_c0_g3~~TRINITY_DN6185_c0_g3_i1.p1  ORF type:complete len:236 (-),score=67.91 TRINITY_DN6185_c0_g3_i1:94-801(-)
MGKVFRMFGAAQSYFHGARHPDTQIFDDGILLGLNGSVSHKVKEIHIFHDASYVFGLEVIYADPTQTLKTISSGPHKGRDAGWLTTTSTFTLADDEFITEVGGGSGAWLDRIHFVTNKQRKQAFGGSGGTPFSYPAPLGYHFATFAVGTGGHLHNIEVRAIPLPAIFNPAVQVQLNSQNAWGPPAGGYTGLPGAGGPPPGGFTSLPGAGGPPPGGYTSLPGAGGPPPGGYTSLPR